MNARDFFYRWKLFFVTVYKRYVEDGCNYRAAGLAYTTLLSIVPLMTVSFAIFSAFPVFKSLNNQVQKFIFNNFVAASGEVVQQYLQNFVNQTSQLSSIGLFFLLVTSVLMIFTLEDAFNSIWRVRVRRKGIFAILLYWSVLTLGPIFIALSIVVSSYVASLPIVSETAKTLGITHILLSITPFILSTIAFTLFYVAIPNCYVPIRYGFIGAVVAAILFETAKFAFGYYVSAFPTYTLIYGALATIPIFLVWIYLMWVIILFGAVISKVLTTGYHYRSQDKIDGFTQIFRWLGYFWKGLQSGRNLSLEDLIQHDTSLSEVDPEKQLTIMLNAQLIQPAEFGRYVLSRDLTKFTLDDLRNSIPWRLPNTQELSHWQGEWEQALAKVINEMEVNNKSILAQPMIGFYENS